MRTLSLPETIDWCKLTGIGLNKDNLPIRPDKALHTIRCDIPKSIDQLTWFCRFVEGRSQPRQHCLLWISAWGIWENSENWHLYYRLRQGYGDFRLMHEASGHLILDYEKPDFVSFLQVGLIAGWDIYVLPSQGYGRAFVSHDGWIEFSMTHKSELEEIETSLAIAAVDSN